MKKYGLIGEKLGHSYSKIIHEKFFELTGETATYELLPIPRDSFDEQMRDIINGGYTGINVTIPYKLDVMEYVDEISEEAKKIGAVNTISFNDDVISAYNTDYYGIMHTFEKFDVDINSKDIVILGTGGASRAVITAVQDMGAKSIKMVSRGKKEFCGLEVIGYDDDISGDVLVNCTPVGMYPNTDATPIDGEIKFNAVVDLIYNPTETKLMKTASSQGIKAVNGLYMLVSQAMCSEGIWHGKKYADDLTDKIYGGMVI